MRNKRVWQKVVFRIWLRMDQVKSIEVEKGSVYDIKWSMLDKTRYFPLTILNMFTVRTCLYPLTLVRTRLQVQTSHSLYSGTLNALTTIVKYEGLSALYKGYWVNTFQLVPHVFYITTYEKVRQQASQFVDNPYIVAFIGGGAGSIIAQLLSVPIDIISQHLMLVGQENPNIKKRPVPNALNTKQLVHHGEIERILVPDSLQKASTIKIVRYLSGEIYRHERLSGFYRGYFLSTFLVSLNSALWWPFYYFYQGQLRSRLPEKMPTIVVQCLCGPLCSISANFITNPLDVMRTRMQVTKQRESSIKVLKILWAEDNYKLFYKGLTARLSYSCFYSFLIILGYETVKKLSLKEEYI